jgi:SH3-like domain-containing protein
LGSNETGTACYRGCAVIVVIASVVAMILVIQGEQYATKQTFCHSYYVQSSSSAESLPVEIIERYPLWREIKKRKKTRGTKKVRKATKKQRRGKISKSGKPKGNQTDLDQRQLRAG